MTKKKSKKRERAAEKRATQAERGQAPAPPQEQPPKAAAHAGHARGRSPGAAAGRRRKLPNWPVLVLALLGVALSAYLSYTTFTRGTALFCGEGGGCDIVQESRWSHLLGLPIALWGLAAYAALAWVAARVRSADWHWKLLFTFSLVGVAVSVYLTAISLLVIEATCTYCLASLGLIALIFLVTLWQKPAGLAGFTWPGWLAQTGGLALIVVLLLHLYHSGWLWPGTGPEDPYLKALAIHLGQSDAKFYGAYWCPVCTQQKELFGTSAERLPYVECSPNGRSAPRAAECVQQGVTNYPSWFINGQLNVGLLDVQQLARMTNFQGPPRQ